VRIWAASVFGFILCGTVAIATANRARPYVPIWVGWLVVVWAFAFDRCDGSSHHEPFVSVRVFAAARSSVCLPVSKSMAHTASDTESPGELQHQSLMTTILLLIGS
jgi:hypothetical protein